MVRRREVLVSGWSEREPDDLVYANLRGATGTVKRVLCEVFLPNPDSPELVLHFLPKPRQFYGLHQRGPFSLTARGREGGYRFAIRGEQVWVSGLSSGGKDGIAFVTACEGRPAWLERTVIYGGRAGTRVAQGRFRLTECPIVNAASIIMRSYTGAVRVKRVVVPGFTLRCGLTIRFKRFFDTTHGKSGQATSSPYLAAEFRPAKPLRKADFPRAVEEFEQFLLLTSFASRFRCVWLEWDYLDERHSINRHFRQDALRPKGPPKPLNDSLIDVADFPEFIRKVCVAYYKLGSPTLLSSALNALLAEGGFLEDDFLRYFSGLQSALWYVYRAHGGTKRFVGVEDLYRFFETKHSVDLGDLWPLFDVSKGVSLTRVRNRLAHGEPFVQRELEALGCALQHLRWVVERVVLAILGWPIDRSKVRAESLRTHYLAYKWDSSIRGIAP